MRSGVAAGTIDETPDQSSRAAEARVLYEIAVDARHDRWPVKAARFARRALAILEHDPRSSRIAVANALLCLAGAYEDQGRIIDAETQYQRTIAELQGAPGTPGDLTAKRLQIRATLGVARVARALGRYRDSESILKHALAAAEQTFGRSDLAVADALNELGVLYKHTARFDNAYRLHRGALGIIERVLGADDQQAATVLHDLATLELARAEFRRAEPFARRAVAVRERAIGPDHPRLAGDVAALASILEGQGKYDDAEALYRRALTIVARWFGPDHDEVAIIVNQLAGLRELRSAAHEPRKRTSVRERRIAAADTSAHAVAGARAS